MPNKPISEEMIAADPDPSKAVTQPLSPGLMGDLSRAADVSERKLLIERIAHLKAAQHPGEPLSDAHGSTAAGDIANAIAKLESELEKLR